MPIIAVSNQKGGVGKTTSTLNLAAALREMGKRVLLVDLDPQGSLTVAAGVLEVDSVHLSVGELLVARAQAQPTDVRQAIVQTPSGLDLVPGNGMLSAAEITLASAANRESVLTVVLAPVLDEYDYVLIDCLPSLGLMAINALRAATGVVIPVQADFLAVQGLAQILETIGAVRAQLNPGLEIYGVLLTMVDSQQSHAQRVVATVRHSLQGQVPVFQAEIAQDVMLKEAAEAGVSILDYKGRSRAADMYRGLAREVARAAGDMSAASAPEPRRGLLADAARFFRGLSGARPDLDETEPTTGTAGGRALNGAPEARVA
ncbi:MAG TPA: AAA family ATPase [Chloroflexota bacterium]|nr:AAA family ATPase [Chloroflexota bacterium]